MDLANIEKMAEAAIADGSFEATHIPNQSQIPNSLSPIESSLISNHPQTIPDTSNMPDDNTENILPKSSHSRISNKSPSLIAVPTTPLSLSTSSNPKINGVEPPKYDTTQRFSLGSHVRIMHSMNSWKCPKCNWNYKYKEALEIHMKKKHPESEMTCLNCVANQPHPRLARGKTYTCGYKHYRCEFCNYSTSIKQDFSRHMQSNKHINKQELQNRSLTVEHISALQQQSQQQQQQQQHSQAATSSPISAGIILPSSNSASEVLTKPQVTPTPKEKASLRCDACNYETNVSQNLKLHMKSKKHTHKMGIHQNIKDIHHLSAMQQAQVNPVFQFHPGLLMPAEAPRQLETNMTYNHAHLMMASQQQHQQKFHQQQRSTGAASAAANAQTHHLLGPSNLSFPAALDMKRPNTILVSDFTYEDKYKIYQCCVCSIYSSDSLEALSQHFQLDTCHLRKDEVLMVVEGIFICKLCMYKTNSEYKLKRHCTTDKHLQKLYHVKEGTSKNEWKLKYDNIGNPILIRCNACEYYTNSLHNMQLHTTNRTHEANSRLFLFLERSESVINSELKSFHCTVCNVSMRTKVNLMQHGNSLAHLSTENLHQTQGESELDMRDIFVVKEAKQNTSETLKDENIDMNNGKNRQTKEDNKPTKHYDTSILDRSSETSENGNSDALRTCPFCNFSSNREVRIQIHVASQHTQKPLSTLVCPLCQNGFREWGSVKIHLMDTHYVDKEGVKRLLALVDETGWMAEWKSNTKNYEDKIKDEMKKEVEQKAVTNGPRNAIDQRTFNVEGKSNELDETMDVEQENMAILSDSKGGEIFLCPVLGTSEALDSPAIQIKHTTGTQRSLTH